MSTPVFVSKINPWTAQPLTEASKDAKLRAVLNLSAERVIYGRQSIMTGWILSGLGIAMMTVSIGGWAFVLPMKSIQNNMWIADRSTGVISKPLSLESAPSSFGTAMEEHALYTYLLANERWIPETDKEDDHLAKVMSAPDLQAIINQRRRDPSRPQIALGNAGHVEIENIHYFPQFMDKGSQTRRYLVRFQRNVWRGPNLESSEPWSATVDFQWHPERTMFPADRELNPGGFVAIAYTADTDNKDTRRK